MGVKINLKDLGVKGKQQMALLKYREDGEEKLALFKSFNQAQVFVGHKTLNGGIDIIDIGPIEFTKPIERKCDVPVEETGDEAEEQPE